MEWNSPNFKVWLDTSPDRPGMRALLKTSSRSVRLIFPASEAGREDDREQEVAVFSPTLRDLHALLRCLAAREAQKDAQGSALENLRRFVLDALEEDSFEALAQKYGIVE